MLICLRLTEVLEMQILIRKIFFVILLCMGLCACSSNGIKDNAQIYPQVSNESSSRIVSVEDGTQAKTQTEWNDPKNEQAYSLNNKATLFGEYLCINSVHTDLIFYDKDNNGNYGSWKYPGELLHGVTGTYRYFKYKDQLICVSHTEDGNSEIIIYNSNLEIENRKKITFFSPQYICGTLLYGHSNSAEYTEITVIDLETLEAKVICELELEKRPDFIINSDKEMIVCEHSAKDKTLFFKFENERLTPIFDTRNSVFVRYDDRGLFYLEENTDSYWNLMLWDGTNIQLIEKVEIDDMNEWIFFNGLPGNVIIAENFYVSIHTLAEEPYVLVHYFDSKNDTQFPLRKWNFSEADMERFGESFSGIYYENCQITNYFFSSKIGELQTQIIDIK